MAYVSTLAAGPAIRIPHVVLPKLRWPRLSQRTRALLMMGIMFSPCVLADTIGYCVQRLFYTADQIADRESPDTVVAKVRMFDVACPAPGVAADEQRLWADYAAQQGWPSYPQAGPGCFRPDRNLRGVLPLKVFSVACPTAVLSASDHRKWAVYAAYHSWTAYPQAGLGCVDP